MMSNSLIRKELDDNDYYYNYERCFPEFFQAHVEEQRLQHQDCRQLGFWSGCLFWSPENEHSDGSSDVNIIREKLMNLSKTDKIPDSCLIQVWRAVEIDGKCFLTTQNQPFIISTKEVKATISEQLCMYRMETSEDGVFQNVGAVDRVFQNQKMEFIPDINYYSSKEYFQQNFASSCPIKGSMAVPLFGFLGVIEIVSIQQMDEHFWHRDLSKFVAYLQENSLTASICKGLCVQEVSTTEVSDVSSTSSKQQLDMGGSTSEECITDSSQTTRGNGGDSISLKEIEKQYGKKRKDAAEALGVSVSTFKRNCRNHNISRWPNTRRKSYVTIKAKYGDNKFLEFAHSESSGYDELHKQVVMRLKREVTVFYQKNHDEMILIACDADLHPHISRAKSSGDAILELTVQ